MAVQAFNVIVNGNYGTLVIGDNIQVNVFINPITTSSHTSGLHGETVRERNTDSGFRRQKRKRGSLVDHVSDSLRSKKIKRKRLERHERNSRFSTSSDEDTLTSMLNKLALTDENGLSLEQALTSVHLYSKRLMQKCADLFCCLDPEEVHAGKRDFAVCRIVRMNLRSETGTSRIEETGKQLENLRNDENYRKRESLGAKIQRLAAEADFYCHKGKFPEAKEKAEKALKIVETRQFNLERKPLQEMMMNIQSKMTASKPEM